MFIRISHPKHVGADRSKTIPLLLGTLFQPFHTTGPGRLLGSFILWSAVLAAVFR